MLLKILKHYWRPFLATVLIFAIVGLSFIFATQTSEAMKIQAAQELDQQWRTDYDLLIRPSRGQADGPSDQELVRRSDMGNHIGGITLDQYEQIKAIQGVEVAAPLSFLGYMIANTPYSRWESQPGLYIIDTYTEVFDGLKYRNVPIQERIVSNIFNIVEEIDYSDIELGRFFLFDLLWARGTKINIPIRDEYFWSVIAVDPEQEKKLLNLDAALIEGEYLPNEQSLPRVNNYPMFPVLLQSKEFDVNRTVTVDKVNNDELSTYLTDPLTYKDELLTFTHQYDVRELPRETALQVEYQPFSSDMIYFFRDLEIINGKLVKGNVPLATMYPNAELFDLGPLHMEQKGRPSLISSNSGRNTRGANSLSYFRK